jgi:hypothetical protein
MAKKNTAARPARATAKKPAAARATAKKPAAARATATEQDFRRALLRLVTRQLECARLGLIGAPEYWLAFSDDLQLARHFCERLKIHNPLPFLIEDSEIEGISGVWIVPAPPRLFKSVTLFNNPSQHFDPTDPNTLRAVNLLAKHTLAEFLEELKAEPKRVELKAADEYMPARYFKHAKIESSTLQKWKANKKIGNRTRNGKNYYQVRKAFELAGIPYELGRSVCDNKQREELGVKNSEKLGRPENI